MYYDKKKDAKPLQTLAKIRGILSELGIFTVETWKYPYLVNEDYRQHSVRIDAPAYGFGTNGKGTTRLYTLASAYGEFMERLQNLIIFPGTSLTEESLAKGGFAYFPDEQKLTIDDIVQGEDAYTKTVFNDFYLDSPWMMEIGSLEKIKAIHTFSGNLEKNKNDKFIGWPFFSVKMKKSVPIWSGLITSILGSNGMSAGNTPQEALVQGLSEIFERYASIEIMEKRLVPPDIPRDNYADYTIITDMIAEIESMGPFKILIKDCSLGLGLPACAAVLFDYEKQRYRVSFGCHPSLPIVLERCLTELLQGYDLGSEEDRNLCLIPIERWKNEIENIDTFINIRNQHINGQGKFPPTFFVGSPSYSPHSFEDFSSATNDEMLKYLLKIGLSLSEDVLIRDVSYLGVPSYFIIIPGISHSRTGWKTLQMESAHNFLREIQNVKEIEEKDLKKLLIGLNLREQSTGRDLLTYDAYRLKLAALFQLEKYEDCIKYINSLLSKKQDDNLHLELKALHFIVILMKEGKKPSDVEKTFSFIFGENIWEEIRGKWLTGQPVKNILKDSLKPINRTRQSDINNLFCNIKNYFAEHKVNQEALESFIEQI